MWQPQDTLKEPSQHDRSVVWVAMAAWASVAFIAHLF